MPVMSDGIRSGVNWMRLKCSDMASARERTSSVLARPGTPTSRAWPRPKMEMSRRSMTSSWPMMTRASCSPHPAGDGAQLVDGGHVVGGLGGGWRLGRSRLIHHKVCVRTVAGSRGVARRWRIKIRISHALQPHLAGQRREQDDEPGRKPPDEEERKSPQRQREVAPGVDGGQPKRIEERREQNARYRGIRAPKGSLRGAGAPHRFPERDGPGHQQQR